MGAERRCIYTGRPTGHPPPPHPGPSPSGTLEQESASAGLRLDSHEAPSVPQSNRIISLLQPPRPDPEGSMTGIMKAWSLEHRGRRQA
ncbi:pancreas/duodenum homeobox protein 1-like [Bubalus kerabau]|uniref:pancreas/duodenum homeobox protein 1-like n=1 Tax=Bubalus carabanensis TaxID=3119969 RepID=UPI00244ECD7F|nr:pancreas/duodenum homeobox protein 1-like [Bubalus carabanensis]